MKKILLALLLFTGFAASAQVLQSPTTWGYQFHRVYADTLFAVPTDTFSVPTSLRTYPFIARKGTTLYLWNTSTFVWGAVSAGGSSSVKVADTLRYTNVINYGADPSGTSGSSQNIQNAINAAASLGYNACFIPAGRYKIEGVDSALILPTGFTLFGAGEQSELFTTTNGTTSTLTSNFNFIELPNARCTVRDLKFTGNGKTTYVFPWTTQNGIWAYGSFSNIYNIRGHNLRGAVIMGVHPSLTAYTGGNITNVRADTCTVGMFTYIGSEYWTISNFQATGNDIGVNEYGANNSYNNCNFSYNRINGQFQGNGGNSDHSYVNGCVFNHGSAANLNIDNIVNSLIFTGGGSWSMSSTVDQSVGVSFSNFQWGTSASLTVTASSTTKTTFLYNCFKATSSPPTFTESGTGKIMEVGTFNSAANSYTINKPVIFTGLPAGVGTKAVRIDASGNLTTADTTVSGGSGWAINGNVGGADGKWLGHSDNFDFNIRTNNTTRLNILKTGELGIGTAGFTGFKFVMYSTGTSASTYSMLLRDLGGANLWSLNDIGSTVQGKSSSSLHNFYGKSYFADGTTVPHSTLQTTSFATGYVAKTTTYTATAADHTIDCTSGTFTVTLPTAASIAGREYTIVNSGSGTITIATTSSQTFTNINGTPTTLTLSPVGAGAITSYTVKATGSAFIVTSKVKNE